MKINLTKSQSLALSKLHDFINSKRHEIILTGSPGYGKSFLIEILEREYNVVKTATTNKAAEIIDGITIYSYLGLALKNNYLTGEQFIDYKKAKYVYDKIIVIDECSMINKELYVALQTYVSPKTKIVYVGDYYQLPPVNGSFTVFSLVQKGVEMVELTEPCRTPNDDILSLCSNLKNSISSNTIFKQYASSENIKIITPNDESLLSFRPLKDKYLSFTNNNVIANNTKLRRLFNKPDYFEEGDYFVCKSVVDSINGYYSTKIEFIEQIKNMKELSEDLHLITTSKDGVFKIYLDPYKYKSKLNELAENARKTKKWHDYFKFKENVLDVRDVYSSTVHSSQGSSYRNVFIDIRDIYRCSEKSQISRLMYVAVSRAKEKVYIVNAY